MRLIGADALMITLMDKDLDQIQDNDGLELCQIIDEQPTIQAVPIEVLQNLYHDIEVLQTIPKFMFNNDVNDFAKAVLYALNNTIKECVG